eukprot:362077-Chlamydomonas_euryale.AAC.15
MRVRGRQRTKRMLHALSDGGRLGTALVGTMLDRSRAACAACCKHGCRAGRHGLLCHGSTGGRLKLREAGRAGGAACAAARINCAAASANRSRAAAARSVGAEVCRRKARVRPHAFGVT